MIPLVAEDRSNILVYGKTIRKLFREAESWEICTFLHVISDLHVSHGAVTKFL